MRTHDGGVTVKALNFSSSLYHLDFVARLKRCTIRLGDKSAEYPEDSVIWVTYGNRFRPRTRVFMAVVDEVKVTRLADLSEEDLRAENPQFRETADVAHFLSQVYDRRIGPDDTVTVVYFSELLE